jgi:hypothetical protein
MAYRAPLTNHHADGSPCPAEHKHTSSGKALRPDSPGRTYTQAICSCGGWEMKQSGKGYVNEGRRRHPASDPKESKVLRDLLRLDGS